MTRDGIRLAQDRSARRIDIDGRLHVELTPISKANLCEYLGREIPDAANLGLEPDRKYTLFRDPDELTKAAPTFNNVPLLSRHPTNDEGALTADNPLTHLIVGSTGTDARFSDPFLENSLVIWSQESITGVLSDRKKEISSGYRYKAVMTPGVYLGASYDGKMTDIIGNHCALVIEGRAGADVLVVDEMPLELRSKETTDMLTSAKAIFAAGAIAAHIKPMLAKDAKMPDLKQVLIGTTARNWQQAKPMIAARLKTATSGKLAADASMEKVHEFLDSLDRPEGMDEMDDMEMDGRARDGETEEERKKREAADRAKDAKRAKDDGITEAEAREKRLADDARRARDARRASDESEETEEEREERMKKRATDKAARDKAARDGETEEQRKAREAEDARRARDSEPKPVTKAAMDAALEDQRVTLLNQWRNEQAALTEAQEIVRPVVGTLMAQDSAEAVYRVLFTQRGVDVVGVPASAFKALARQTVLAATAKPATLARDTGAPKGFADRFPDAARIRLA